MNYNIFAELSSWLEKYVVPLDYKGHYLPALMMMIKCQLWLAVLVYNSLRIKGLSKLICLSYTVTTYFQGKVT